MIKTQQLVPSYYYKQSRDFQFLGRTFDVIFNYLKSNIDVIYSLPYSDNSPLALVELLCTTLGFKRIHEYTSIELKCLCSIFPYIMKHKGSKKSIQTTLDLLCRLNNIEEQASYVVDVNDSNNLLIYLPTDISDYTLLIDILDYILPAGLTYSIIKTAFKDVVVNETSKYSEIVEHVNYDAPSTVTSVLPKRVVKDDGKLDLTNSNSNMTIAMRVDNEGE